MMNEPLVIKNEKCSVIPIEYNIMLKQNQYSFGGVPLSEKDFEWLLDYCKDSKSLIIFDFSYIEFVDDRLFQKLTESRVRDNVGIAHIKDNKLISKEFYHEMEDEGIMEENGIVYFSNKYTEMIKNIGLDGLYQEKIREIVHMTMESWESMSGWKSGEYGYLSSSGVYSNKIIDLKKLFYSHRDTLYIVLQLYHRIKEWDGKYDYLVATSKNGVAIGSILSDILHKELLCLNIGQMFEEIYNMMPAIKKGKKYVHIFDMICIGSEIKVANALISAKGGEMVKSFGVVCMQNLEAIQKYNRFSALKNVTALIEYKDLKMDYMISLDNPINEGDKN